MNLISFKSNKNSTKNYGGFPSKKSVSALEDKEKEIREKDDLLNKAVGRIENTYDNFNRLYEMAKPFKENVEIALKLLKILLKELMKKHICGKS